MMGEALIKRLILDLETDEDAPYHYDITALVENTIKKLKSCSTVYYEDDEESIIYLDYLVNDATKKAFKLHFGSPLELFQALQVLLCLNLYTVSAKSKQELYNSPSIYVNETVPVLASDERVMRIKHFDIKRKGLDDTVLLKSFSDGEFQYLHSLGLCLLYKNTNSLFLLDEAETHFNPDWRSGFISVIRDCFKLANSDKQREMLITTHSPFLISDSKPENVFLFEKDEKENIVKIETPKFNTLGTSINKITMDIFNKKETIGGYADQLLEQFEQRFEEMKADVDTEEKQTLIDEINHKLGDSVEKILLIKTILDSMDPGFDSDPDPGGGGPKPRKIRPRPDRGPVLNGDEKTIPDSSDEEEKKSKQVFAEF